MPNYTLKVCDTEHKFQLGLKRTGSACLLFFFLFLVWRLFIGAPRLYYTNIKKGINIKGGILFGQKNRVTYLMKKIAIKSVFYT